MHLDCRFKTSEEIERIHKNLIISHRSLFNQIIPKSRLNNSFAHFNKTYKMTRKSRYLQVNSCSLNKHRTLEVRSHSATLSPRKIFNWVRMLKLIEKLPADMKIKLRPSTFIERVKMPKSLINYVTLRRAKFMEFTACETN